ncbi:hypothetical protein X975_13643, partial [Stegodyphus mimosarum]
MLWGTFSWVAGGSLAVIEENMKAADCLNVTADHLHPYMVSVFPTGNGIFQQYNAVCHKVRIILEWF